MSSVQVFPLMQRSVAGRLFGISFLFYIVLASLLTGALVAGEYLSARTTVKHDLTLYERAFSSTMVQALRNRNDEELDAVLHGMLNIPEIGAVQVLDPASGQVLGMALNQEGRILVGRDQRLQSAWQGLQRDAALEHDFDIVSHGETGQLLGRVRIVTMQAQLIGRIREQSLLIIGVSLLKEMFLWVIFLLVGRMVIVRPLAELIRSVNAISPGQSSQIDFSLRSGKIIAGTELTMIRDAFNRLIERIEGFGLMIESAIDFAIFRLDKNGHVTSWNMAAERIKGHRPEDVIGRHVSVFYPRQDVTEGKPQRELQVAAVRGSAADEGWRMRKDGSRFWANVIITALRDDSGQLRGFVKMTRDLTEQRSAAAKLNETLMLQSAILDSTNASIIATASNGAIVSVNRAAERMLGYSAAELIGHHTPALLHDPEEMRRRAMQLSEELKCTVADGFDVLSAKTQQGLKDENEWTMIRKDGSRLPVLLSVTALANVDGGVSGYLCLAVDLSERKKIERMKNEFISTVSHELRTPLTSIRGSLGLLTKTVAGKLSPQAASLIDIAYRNSERLVHLISDILDIEKVESGKLQLTLETVDVVQAMRQAVADNQGYAEQFGIVLAINTVVDCATIDIDRHRLGQIMDNLLSNAIKFSPPGGQVEVSIAVLDAWVQIAVKDHGQGVPQEFQAQIFEKFSQADASDSRKKGGTGLGLAIARSLVESMGGAISYRDTRGGGATFVIAWPMRIRVSPVVLS